MINSKRRGFFTSVLTLSNNKKNQDKKRVYPPYCSDESLILNLCPNCQDKPCANVCEEEIIFIDKNGVPTLNFKERGCTFCEACADACESSVLDDKTLTFINATVEIDLLKCIAWHQVMCSSCKEPCLEDAIKFLGLFRPEIDSSKCTACGWCKSVCPTEAINIKTID